MKELFVPHELAINLTKLGFNEDCFGYYGEPLMGKQERFSLRLDWTPESYPFKNELHCLAPLWQQAFDWFREKHHIDSAILPNYSTKYYYRLYEQQSKSKTQIYGDYMGKEYETYEEARLAYLKKLIEICQQN